MAVIIASLFSCIPGVHPTIVRIVIYNPYQENAWIWSAVSHGWFATRRCMPSFRSRNMEYYVSARVMLRKRCLWFRFPLPTTSSQPIHSVHVLDGTKML
ncbi:hypothetical protein CYLTODRAFT_288515 [Cylindrobasidium torrendii FP15055 ss-10]|uniref:Secreted protein n=1 Tax=Cylindrobasidium torrendii FP15055 ss-10 TaxID=1314674 RepID=A0A0D7BBF7_9AGAR|nr:hypothetical protein CYLTODRAFT_288515 [Cylindrobasidium torrendii FP15055 ss-10]